MKRNIRGISLVEVIIAIAIFSLVAGALINVLIGSYLGTRSLSVYQQGLIYAREGLSAAKSVRNQAWNNLAVGEYGLSFAANHWQFSGSSELLDSLYTRKIIIENVYRDGSGNIVLSSEPGAVLDLHTKKITCQVTWPTQAGSNNQINLPTYVSSWQSENFIQTNWQNGPGQSIWSDPAKYFSDDGNIDYATAGQIKLKQNGPPIITESFGNQFLISALDSAYRLNAQTNRQSLRFTAQKTGSVNQVRVYINTRASQPTYRFGLQADSSGNPSGSWLGYGDVSPGATGWLAVNLNQAVSLVQGQVYHLVIAWQTGTIGSSRYIILRQSSPLNNLIPFNQAADASANVLFSTNGGTSWQVLGLQPIYHLTFTDATYEGNPYDNWLNNLSIYGNNLRGQYFNFSANKELSQISFYLRRQGTSPAADLRFTIFNITDNIQVASDILVSRQSITATYAWYTYNFPTPIIFTAGKNYRVYLSSTGANSTNYYVVAAVYSVDQAVLKAVNFAGTISYYQYSANNGSSWTSQDYTDLNFVFKKSRPSYATYGEIISSAYNTGSASAFDFLSWQEQLAANTDIKVQLATAPNNGGVPGAWSAWLGLNGAGTYYQDNQETLIPLVNGHNDAQFIRYRAVLTSDGANTPILDEIKINYTP